MTLWGVSLQKGSSCADLHGGASKAVSQLGLQCTAGVVDLGVPVLELVSFVKHCHVPWDSQHVFQVAPTDQLDASACVSHL